MRSREAVLAVALVATLYGAAVTGPAAVEGPASVADRLISPDGTDGYVWPYTSRTRSATGRTLALNVVVRGDTDRVRRSLRDRSDANWSAIDRTETIEISPWRPAHGSTRYTYVTSDRNATGRWIEPAYQLDVGTYFGRRTHIRAYAGPTGNWTAIQAHTEYWDWFRVRHTVTGVETGARFVERDLRDEPFVASVTRSNYGYDGSNGGTWTVIDLVPAVFVAGLATRTATRRLSPTDAPLPVALVGIVLGVRAGGLLAETILPGVSPKLFVVLGYPLLAAGPPVLVAARARERPATRSALLATGGLGVGLALDLLIVGVRTIPTHLALHRIALLAALGLVALGAGRRERDVIVAGILAWVLVLAAPLFGVV